MIIGLGDVCSLVCCLIAFQVIQTHGLFDYFDSRLVVLNPQPLEWTEAAAECKLINGTLLTVTDTATMYDIGIEGRWVVWFGLKTDGISSTWHSGNPVTWTNWEVGYSPVGGGEQCLSLETFPPYTWNSKNCSTKLPSLCEIKTGQSCQFNVERGSSVVGFSSFQATDFDLEMCRNACIHNSDFVCQSFEYNEKRRFCQLSKTNRWSHISRFTNNDAEWDYYHMDCYTNDMNKTWTPNGVDEPTTTSEPVTEEPIEICFTMEDLLPNLNETKEIETAIQELQDLATIYKNRQRSLKKESVVDDRPSATYVGTVAMIIVCSFLGIIVILDLLTVSRHCCKKTKERKRLKETMTKQPNIGNLAQGRSILAERERILAARASSSSQNGTAAGGNHYTAPIEIEDVRVKIRPSKAARNPENDNESPTLQICRVDSDNTYKFPVRLSCESIIRAHTLPARESKSHINSAYVNTSPILSPFHRSQSEKNAGPWRSSQSLELTPPGRSVRSTSDPFSSNTVSGSTYTMWPYSNKNRMTIKYNSALKRAEKYLLAYGNDFQTDERMETFKQ